ncbi:MAG: hypothetical protein ACT4O0_10850 [Pseudonocardia sp.]
MTSDNPTADRLLSDARKKTAQLESPLMAQIALALGVLAVISGALVPIAGWVLGALAAGLAVVSIQRVVAVKLARIALIAGIAGILVATFRFSLYIAG